MICKSQAFQENRIINSCFCTRAFPWFILGTESVVMSIFWLLGIRDSGDGWSKGIKHFSALQQQSGLSVQPLGGAWKQEKPRLPPEEQRAAAPRQERLKLPCVQFNCWYWELSGLFFWDSGVYVFCFVVWLVFFAWIVVLLGHCAQKLHRNVGRLSRCVTSNVTLCSASPLAAAVGLGGRLESCWLCSYSPKGWLSVLGPWG